MPCDSIRREGETLEQRIDVVKKALTRLEQALTQGRVKVTIGPTGAVSFAGWGKADRDDVTDVCAYRTLAAQGSWALRQAVARAESQQGRKVNPHAVAAGHHSHDSGVTWHKGHK